MIKTGKRSGTDVGKYILSEIVCLKGKKKSWTSGIMQSNGYVIEL